MQKKEVLPRFELGLLDSESRVLTVTPQDQVLLAKMGLDFLSSCQLS